MAIQQKMLLKQSGKLSPQQILEQELLPLNAMSMEQHLRTLVEENPALESSEDFEQKEDNDNDDLQDMELSEDFSSEFSINEDGEYEETLSPYKEYSPQTGYIDSISNDRNLSIYEYVQSKVSQISFSPQEQKIAEQIIGNLDEYGFLQSSEQDIADHFLLYLNQNISVKEVSKVRQQIQSIDPVGIASTQLSEYLAIQLQEKIARDTKSPSLQLALQIIQKHFQLFLAKNYESLIKKTKAHKDDLMKSLHIIEHLRPYPMDWDNHQVTLGQSIVPDFSIFFRDDILETHINEKYFPKLKMNKEFYELYQHGLNGAKEKKAKNFIHKDIQKAEFIIQAIKMRYETLRRVIEYIAKVQIKYFETGDDTQLVPLLMKDIATHCSRDISTISRALSGKYVETDWGIKPAKFFVNHSVSNLISGEKKTHHHVEETLQNLIETEDKQNPFTDEQLTELMAKSGYSFSRKTILFLREKLGISPSKARRKI